MISPLAVMELDQCWDAIPVHVTSGSGLESVDLRILDDRGGEHRASWDSSGEGRTDFNRSYRFFRTSSGYDGAQPPDGLGRFTVEIAARDADGLTARSSVVVDRTRNVCDPG
jgi:hypothetical protein